MHRRNGVLHVTIATCTAFALLLGGANTALALKVGDTVKNLKVRDSNDNPAWIPDLGKKVLTIFYTDPDEKDMNEPFRDMLKAAKLDKTTYRGLGIVNLKDTWKPNFIIRKVIRGKIKKFKSTILTDPAFIVRNQWHMGDCNNKDVVIVVGKDKKVKFIKKGPLTAAEKKATLALIRAEMKK